MVLCKTQPLKAFIKEEFFDVKSGQKGVSLSVKPFAT